MMAAWEQQLQAQEQRLEARRAQLSL